MKKSNLNITSMSLCRLGLRATLFLCLLIGSVTKASTPGTHFKKILILVLENTDYAVAMKDPYLNSLTNKGALLTNFNGTTHPSQGNYISMIGGDTYGVNKDDVVNIDGPSIIDLLEARGLTWSGYFEGYPGNCFVGASDGHYVRKHNPFISFKSVATNPERCARIKNSASFADDYQNEKLANYSIYVPDLENDGHDTGVTFASNWLRSHFDAAFNDPSFLQDTVVVITFDESATKSNNHIYAVVLGQNVKPGSKFELPLSHVSLLRLTEDEFELGTLNKADSKSNAITGIWSN